MEFLSKSVLAAMMINATHYVDIGAETDAVIYYETESVAHMVLPDGTALSGAWKLTNQGYHVAWTGGPEGDWRLSHAPGRIGYVDGTGKDFGPVTRIVYGNPEALPR